LDFREKDFVILGTNRHDVLTDSSTAKNMGIEETMIFEWRERNLRWVWRMLLYKDMIVFVFTEYCEAKIGTEILKKVLFAWPHSNVDML
jgi:hypothetical protein